MEFRLIAVIVLMVATATNARELHPDVDRLFSHIAWKSLKVAECRAECIERRECRDDPRDTVWMACEADVVGIRAVGAVPLEDSHLLEVSVDRCGAIRWTKRGENVFIENPVYSVYSVDRHGKWHILGQTTGSAVATESPNLLDRMDFLRIVETKWSWHNLALSSSTVATVRVRETLVDGCREEQEQRQVEGHEEEGTSPPKVDIIGAAFAIIGLLLAILFVVAYVVAKRGRKNNPTKEVQLSAEPAQPQRIANLVPSYV